jgi:hypothetical protein
MTKPLKSIQDLGHDLIITNHQVAALVRPALTPTPLAFPAPSRARRDPPGGPRAPVSLPLAPTPYGYSGPTSGQGARKEVRVNGVGGAGLPYPGMESRGDLTGRVRT